MPTLAAKRSQKLFRKNATSTPTTTAAIATTYSAPAASLPIGSTSAGRSGPIPEPICAPPTNILRAVIPEDVSRADVHPVAGELVTETLDYDGGRRVTAYVPPTPPEAIVFAGDGQMVAAWGEDLEAADGPPTMIGAAHRVEDETRRIQEDSPGGSTTAFAFDAERFAAHERFFVEEVRQWARARFDVALPGERTAVFGVSASGELALAMGMRHPEIYGAVFCASPGAGYRPPAAMPSSLP